MREIVLDTETTGFEPSEGHRLVEIGCVELINHLPSGRTFHKYINPEREMPAGAFAVHGLSDEFLKDQPLFETVADAFLEFVGGDRLVIHNAAFDIKFLNFELSRTGRKELEFSRVVDTLAMARRKFPGAQASLDALVRRFGIDGSARTLHGALLDSQLLAEVYLELLGGRQTGLDLGQRGPARPDTAAGTVQTAQRRIRPLAERITAAEAEAHRQFVEKLGPSAIWLKSK